MLQQLLCVCEGSQDIGQLVGILRSPEYSLKDVFQQASIKVQPAAVACLSNRGWQVSADQVCQQLQSLAREADAELTSDARKGCVLHCGVGMCE